ncbi:hypothetical protein PAHAL_8G154400 [Panicum hallii]|uniref:Uncharacterized protein n=1 Tax=Panicum hallii TaxID=206008 RepID=A0A2T8I8Y5_9POAL|nr:hypothetical protein PAHAL_8G154400 [Panicum hallii]
MNTFFFCSQVSKSSRVPWTLSRLWNPNLLGALHGRNDFHGHPNKLVPCLALLVDHVSHHHVFFLLEELECALFLVNFQARLGVGVDFLLIFFPFLFVFALIGLVVFLMA